MEARRPVDPFTTLPIIPPEWRLVRRLLQSIVGVVFLVAPGLILDELKRVDGLSTSWTLSVALTSACSLLLVAFGYAARRRLSKVGGTLVMVGSSAWLTLYLAMHVYIYWTVRTFAP